jgi:hypothetical protein
MWQLWTEMPSRGLVSMYNMVSSNNITGGLLTTLRNQHIITAPLNTKEPQLSRIDRFAYYVMKLRFCSILIHTVTCMGSVSLYDATVTCMVLLTTCHVSGFPWQVINVDAWIWWSGFILHLYNLVATLHESHINHCNYMTRSMVFNVCLSSLLSAPTLTDFSSLVHIASLTAYFLLLWSLHVSDLTSLVSSLLVVSRSLSRESDSICCNLPLKYVLRVLISRHLVEGLIFLCYWSCFHGNTFLIICCSGNNCLSSRCLGIAHIRFCCIPFLTQRPLAVFVTAVTCPIVSHCVGMDLDSDNPAFRQHATI